VRGILTPNVTESYAGVTKWTCEADYSHSCICDGSKKRSYRDDGMVGY